MPRELADIRTQGHLQRELAIILSEAVSAAIAAGLHPDNAFKAVTGIWESEQRFEQSRRSEARTYA